MSDRLLSPYEVDRDGPWDARAAAHLLRRAGFGATRQEIGEAVATGMEGAVEDLFDDAEDQEEEFQDTFQRISGSFVDFADVSQLRAWWCYRMMRTVTPLREKLTLFWHGHFATSIAKVEDAYLMHRQIETLRKYAWGNFRDLVVAIAKDAAMLAYLDGESNTREHPNENFAREVMELFTLGIGNYGERDVLEAARAFTGWQRAPAARVEFHPELHDAGPKGFLGRHGRFKAEDIVDILMLQPATPRFIARKLLVFFACPEPAESVIAEAAELLVETRLNIEWFLRDLFRSRYFYEPVCRRTRISSPAEFVIGTCRSLGARVAGTELAQQMAAMGQELFAPPNVKGWDGERKWIHSTAWAARVAFAEQLRQAFSDHEFGSHLNLANILPPDLTDPGRIVDIMVDELLEGDLPPDTRTELARFLVSNEQGPQPEAFRTDADFRNQQLRQTLGLILGLPEYHTC